MIFNKEYIGEPIVQIINDDTFLVIRGKGDWHVYTFINADKGIVSKNYDDISTYNQSKVVYATLEDGYGIKIIVQDIFDEAKYYMEIERDYAPMAVPQHVIIDTEFIDNTHLMLEYYTGENLEVTKEIIDLQAMDGHLCCILMNIIYAEYNIHHNSIDIATAAGYLLRIDCREAEKGLQTIPSSECALNALAIDEPLEYARLYLESNMQMWINTEDSLELW